MADSPLRIVLADDHYLVREGTRELLEGTGRVKVLDAVADAQQLLEAVRAHRPDAVITDIRMPPSHRKEGIEAAHAIRSEHPSIGVVVLSQYADPLYALDLLAAGTEGYAYLIKDRVGQVDELVRALTEVASGGSVIDPAVVETLLSRRQRQAGRAGPGLTPREVEVLREMAQGRSNAGIAEALVLSTSAVEKHVNSIFGKLGLPADAGTHRRVSAVLTYLGSFFKAP